MIEIAAPTTDGSNHKLPSTPMVIATDPRKPISATRKLVSCKRVTARLIVFGIAAVNASEITNQMRIANSRVPKKIAES